MDEGSDKRGRGRRRKWVRWCSGYPLLASAVNLLTHRARRSRRGRLPLASMSAAALEEPSPWGDEEPEAFAATRHVRDERKQDPPSSASLFPLVLVPPTRHWFTEQEQPSSSRQHAGGFLHAMRHPLDSHRHHKHHHPSGEQHSQHHHYQQEGGVQGVKIYDFSVYVDEAAAGRAAATSSTIPGTHGAALMAAGAPAPSPQDLLSHVLRSPEVPASIILRAARDLPMELLHREMGRVLERRYVKAGGGASDQELAQLLSCFSAAALPAPLRTANGTAVRRGATMVFSRAAGGVLAANALGVLGDDAGQAIGQRLGQASPMMPAPVHSPVLCEALLDLYLGTEPVSKKAKAAAVTSLQRMARPLEEGTSWGPPARGVVYSPVESQGIVCGQAAPGAEPVDACVLHVP